MPNYFVFMMREGNVVSVRPLSEFERPTDDMHIKVLDDDMWGVAQKTGFVRHPLCVMARHPTDQTLYLSVIDCDEVSQMHSFCQNLLLSVRGRIRRELGINE